MPSPRKISPSPNVSDWTSCLKERSIGAGIYSRARGGASRGRTPLPLGQKRGDEFGDDRRRLAVTALGEMAAAERRLEIELDGARAGGIGFGDEAGRRIDIPRRTDRDKQIAARQCRADPFHLQWHFAEPDDVRAHGTG